MAEEKKKPSKKKDEKFPEHESIVGFNTQIEDEKKEARKLAKQLREKSGTPEAIVVTYANKVKKASELTKDEQKYEFIKCGIDPIYFISTYLTIFDQTKGDDGMIVPFKLFPFQEDLIAAYQENRFNVANKYRQAGISTTTCAYIAWYVMFKKNRSVAIVANKLETARDELMFDVIEFIEGCPEWLKPRPDKKDTQKLKRYTNGSSLGAFSSVGLRGYTPTLLFWDETAWTEKNDKFWEGTKPTLQTGGGAIFVSTPNGLDPVFYKTFENGRKNVEFTAKGKRKGFNAIELWWYNDPRYNKDLSWVKNKGKEDEVTKEDENRTNKERIILMDDGWEATSPWFEEQVVLANYDMRKVAQEILCSFLGSGDNFIAEEYLKRIDDHEIQTPIRQEYLDKNFWIWEDPEPGAEYIMALDASAGHGDDFSTINMLKLVEVNETKYVTKKGVRKEIKYVRHKVVQVAEYYGKQTPNVLAEIAYQYGIRYNNAYCVVDITGGYGVQSVEKIINLGYENIHYAEVNHKPSRDRLNGYVKSGTKTLGDGTTSEVDLIPGFFIGQNRGSILIELQRSVHLSDLVVRSVRLLNEFKTFVTVPGSRVADHKRSFHDDSIMGLSLGLYVINFDMKRYRNDSGKVKSMLNAMLKVNNNENYNKELEQKLALEKEVKKKNRLVKEAENRNRNTKTPDFRDPYSQHSWLFNKNR